MSTNNFQQSLTKKETDTKRKNKLVKNILLIISAIILISISVIGYRFFIIIKENKNEVTQLYSCSSDSDCIVISKSDPLNPCCSSDECEAEVVNKEEDDRKNAWRLENCSRAKCLLYDCFTPKIPKARCKENSCMIEWKER